MKARTLIATLLFVFFAATPAWAGPPLLCHPKPIGSAQSLPWRVTASWNGMNATYNVSHLISDTLNLLAPSIPTNVREETLRRAAIYSSREPGLAARLSSRLLARTQSTQNDPSAWFDVGYFVETAREAAIAFPDMRADLPNIDGLAFIHKAIRLGGKNMEQAAQVVQTAQAEH